MLLQWKCIVFVKLRQVHFLYDKQSWALKNESVAEACAEHSTNKKVSELFRRVFFPFEATMQIKSPTV